MGTLPPINKTSTFGTTTVQYDVYTTQGNQCPGTLYLAIDTKTMIPIEGGGCDLQHQVYERIQGIAAARDYVIQVTEDAENELMEQMNKCQAAQCPPTPPPLPPSPTPWTQPPMGQRNKCKAAQYPPTPPPLPPSPTPWTQPPMGQRNKCKAAQCPPTPPPLPPSPTPWTQPGPSPAFCAELDRLAPKVQIPATPGRRQQWAQTPQRDMSVGLPSWVTGSPGMPDPEFCSQITQLAPRQQCPELGAGGRPLWPRVPGEEQPSAGWRPDWAGGPTQERHRPSWGGYEGPTHGPKPRPTEAPCLPQWATRPATAPTASQGLAAPQPTRSVAPARPRPTRTPTNKPPETRPPWRAAGSSGFFGQPQHMRPHPREMERPESRLAVIPEQPRSTQERRRAAPPPTAGPSGRQGLQPQQTRVQSSSAFGRKTPSAFGMRPQSNQRLTDAERQQNIEDIVERFNRLEETAFEEVQQHGGQQSILNQSVAALDETSKAPQ